MHIMVTNDDGVTAPGLLALAQEIRQIADVSILAPDRNWSGGGHIKTIDRHLRIAENGTDIGALSEGFVSITPLQLDLTAYPAVHMLDSWRWKLGDNEK